MARQSCKRQRIHWRLSATTEKKRKRQISTVYCGREREMLKLETKLPFTVTSALKYLKITGLLVISNEVVFVKYGSSSVN